MNDLIERQAAIEALTDYIRNVDKVYSTGKLSADDCRDAAKSVLDELPPAQPERISDPDRVYDELSKVYNMKDLSDEVYSIIGDLMLSLHETERKKGKWQITDAYPHNVYCSECHTRFAQTHWAVWEDGSLPRNFCPNCGSYNGGENDQSK